MAVSRRLRYEILRRDDHTCRYCGRSAPEVSLTVDHVKPVALGGTDAPENLVAACADCNAGKTSLAPGSPLVADVEADAVRWAKAIEAAAYIKGLQYQLLATQIEEFDRWWLDWKTQNGQGDHLPRDPNWPDRVERFLQLGLTIPLMVRLIGVAMRRPGIHPDDTWAYFCGCCWKELDALQAAARNILADEGAT